MTACLPVAALPDLVARLLQKGAPKLDLVGRWGGNSSGKFHFTPDVAHITTEWTGARSVKNKQQKWEFQVIKEVNAAFPFRILGINCDDRSQFITWEPFRWRAQKYWHVMRQEVGCERNGTPSTRSHASSPILDRSASPRKPDSSAMNGPSSPAAIQRRIQALPAHSLAPNISTQGPATKLSSRPFSHDFPEHHWRANSHHMWWPYHVLLIRVMGSTVEPLT